MNLQWKVQSPASACTDLFLPYPKQWWHLSHSEYATATAAALHCMNLFQHKLSLPLGNKKNLQSYLANREVMNLCNTVFH